MGYLENRTKTYEMDEHPFELQHVLNRLNPRLDKIADSLEKSEFKDILENYADPKKRIITNLMAGISRGLGLSLGKSILMLTVKINKGHAPLP